MKSRHSIGTLCLALLLGVGLSGALLGTQLLQHTAADTVIALTAEPQAAAAGNTRQAHNASKATTRASQTPAAQSAAAAQIAVPGFEVRDDQIAWTTDTEVAIFRASYDETGEITVDGQGDHVVAPGTANRYDFTLKNTGNVPVDYRVWVEVQTDTGSVTLPLTARLSRSGGNWLVGSAEQWPALTELDQVEESRALDAGSAETYSLEWQWPYERGADEADTLIGNAAVQQDLDVTVVIHTVAVADETATPTDTRTPGILNGLPFAPQTGDTAPILLLCIVCACSGAGVLVLVLMRRKQKKNGDNDTTA